MVGRSKGSKKTKVELNRMTNITPSSIAYSVGQMNLHKLFRNVVGLFEYHPEDKWCMETLEWWNE